MGPVQLWPQTPAEYLTVMRTQFIRLMNRHCDQVQAAGTVDDATCSLEEAIDADQLNRCHKRYPPCSWRRVARLTLRLQLVSSFPYS
jgi:hypothetical protein